MTGIHRIIFLAFVLTVSVQASTDEGYANDLDHFKTLQRQSRQRIRKLQAKAGIFPPGQAEGEKSQKEEERPPLLRVHGELSSTFLPAGKFLYGRVFNRLIVGSDGSPALIELDEGQGGLSKLRLMGTARQSGTVGRVTIEVDRILLRSGHSVPIHALAHDTDGAYGLEAQVFSSKALAFAGSLATSFIAGAAASQQTQSTNAFGMYQQQPGDRNAILQGIAQSAADQSKRFISDATSEKPILVVESQTPVSVLVQQEVRF